LADQPLEVVAAVSAEEAQRLFERLRSEGVHVFYVKTPMEFGTRMPGLAVTRTAGTVAHSPFFFDQFH